MSDDDPGRITSAWCNHRWWRTDTVTGGTALTPFRLWHLVAGRIDVDTGTSVERYLAGQWVSAPRSFTTQTMHAGTELISLSMEWRLADGTLPLQHIPDGVLALGRHGRELRRLLLAHSDLLEEIASSDEAHALSRSALARGGLWRIAGLLMGIYPEPKAGSSAEQPIDTRVALAMRTLRQRARSPFSEAQLAQATGLGRRRLEQLFLAKVGVGPRAYHARLRMEEARSLVVQGRLQFKEIAAHLGFISPAAFTQAFIRSHGMSPSACQAQART